MKNIPNESVDVIIADPPYNIGKDFGNKSDKRKMSDYIEWSNEWINQATRILKPSGTMYIYGFSEILAHISVNIDLPKRWLIWHYTNKNSPRSTFWGRSHESIICCWKNNKERIFNLDDVREPYTAAFLKNAAGKTRKSTKGRFTKKSVETTYTAHKNGALPRDVIKVAALAGGAGKKEKIIKEDLSHPTQKPFELTNKLIKASKPQNDCLVVIPFAGSGSECVVAKQLGCNFIGFEINKEYVDLANDFIGKIK
jgi:site-specific DNA-methyltransferase (adenine-specific)